MKKEYADGLMVKHGNENDPTVVKSCQPTFTDTILSRPSVATRLAKIVAKV